MSSGRAMLLIFLGLAVTRRQGVPMAGERRESAFTEAAP
jgi:hypothetical protein